MRLQLPCSVKQSVNQQVRNVQPLTKDSSETRPKHTAGRPTGAPLGPHTRGRARDVPQAAHPVSAITKYPGGDSRRVWVTKTLYRPMFWSEPLAYTYPPAVRARPAATCA